MKKIIFVVIGLLVISAGGAGASMLSSEDEKPEIRQVKVDKIEPKEVELKEPVEVENIEAVESIVEVQTSQPEPAIEEPVVESPPTTQQYAEKHLDLSGQNQLCFDEVIKAFPERFTPDVRENNIKALTAYANVCATGILHNLDPNQNPTGNGMKKRGHIYLYGQNGEFFDSDVAKSAH